MIGGMRVRTGIAAGEGKCPMEFAVAEAATGMRTVEMSCVQRVRRQSAVARCQPPAPCLQLSLAGHGRRAGGPQGRGPSLHDAQGQEGASTHKAALARLAAAAGQKPSAGLPRLRGEGRRTCKAA